VLLFTLGLAAATSVLFGLAPAFTASRGDIQEGLKESGRSSTAGSGRRWFRDAMVVTQVALSLVLLVGAGLLIESFRRLQSVNTGFRAENLLTLRVTGIRVRGAAQVTALFRRIQEHVRAIPGVISVGGGLNLPAGGGGIEVGRGFIVEGRPAGDGFNAGYQTVTPDYFRSMGIGLRRGRDFSDRDEASAPKVMIINEALARTYFPGEDPIGKRIVVWKDETFPREIVGVVADTKSAALESPAEPAMFVPHAQDPWPLALAIRCAGDPAAVVQSVRREIHRAAPGLAVFSVRTGEQVLLDALSQRRFNLFLLAVFAGLALLLAAVGLYGVISFIVTQRTRELGVRVALGATQADLVRLVVGRGMTLVAAGILLGILAAAGFVRLISGMLFGVQPLHPLAFAAAAIVLGVSGLAACAIPARRAARVDPLTALHQE
jgi:putative ABC transport system permease protein